ncbi:zincin-like metallopeptidase domain-containing protein [Rhizobium sp. FKY42]|uniref:zincin-like metallopeptidase domain-containing protein n=1 Tax=Rhizobium sp. FKY42 TaxID=2562310 RepID=UPI0010BF97EC|nr:zincin-like metallopeptidase domain-containing protein [Rhizobium sp. FKY42]
MKRSSRGSLSSKATAFSIVDRSTGSSKIFRPTIKTVEAKERLDHADTFFADTGVDIRFGGKKAFNMISDDFIGMPPFEAFESKQTLVSTLAHETALWTRHAGGIASPVSQMIA